MRGSEFLSCIKSKGDLYFLICNAYYLPQLSDRSVTIDYLQNYLFEDLEITVIEKEKIVNHSYDYRGKDRKFLLEYLENLLAKKGLKPSGFSQNNAPSCPYLKDFILHFEPEDKLNLLVPEYIGRKLGNDSGISEEDKKTMFNPK